MTAARSSSARRDRRLLFRTARGTDVARVARGGASSSYRPSPRPRCVVVVGHQAADAGRTADRRLGADGGARRHRSRLGGRDPRRGYGAARAAQLAGTDPPFDPRRTTRCDPRTSVSAPRSDRRGDRRARASLAPGRPASRSTFDRRGPSRSRDQGVHHRFLRRLDGGAEQRREDPTDRPAAPSITARTSLVGSPHRACSPSRTPASARRSVRRVEPVAASPMPARRATRRG